MSSLIFSTLLLKLAILVNQLNRAESTLALPLMDESMKNASCSCVDVVRQFKSVDDTLKEQGETLNEQGEALKIQGDTLKKQAATLNELGQTLNNHGETLNEQSNTLNNLKILSLAQARTLKEQGENLNSLNIRMNAQDEVLSAIYNYLKTMSDPKDCNDILASGNSVSGVYRVYPDRQQAVDVFCDMTTPGGPWLVFQRRKDGSEYFERNWFNYTNGFGKLDGEFWLGNENLYWLTSTRRYSLRVDLEDFTGQKRYAEYRTVSINSASDNYRLNVAGYSGDAGDSMIDHHNGYQFSTIESRHDNSTYNCAEMYRGAWWYSNCHYSNLNGAYLRGNTTVFAAGVVWYTWLGHYYSLKFTEMKITRIV